MNKEEKEKLDKDPVKYVESLLDAHKVALTEKNDQIKDFKSNLEIAAKKLIAANGKIALLESDVESKDLRNGELEAKLSEHAEELKLIPGTFTHNKKEYGFKEGFMKTLITSRLVGKSEDLQEFIGQKVDSSEIVEHAKWAPVRKALVLMKYGGLELK